MNRSERYYVYITTNQHRTTLYIGVTNDLHRRAEEHLFDAVFTGNHFAGKNQSYYLIYYEAFSEIAEAIAREKQLKGWMRKKKLALIHAINPELRFLNEELTA